MAAEDCFFKPSYKSGLVARVYDGYKSLDSRTIGTCHDRRAVASKLAPSLTFEQLVCHHDVAFVICVTPQDVNPILLLAGHHLYSWPESVLKVEFPMKNARVKPVI